MITVHHLEHSRSHRVVWLLEELGVDYRIVHYPRDPRTGLAPESLRKIHPLGKSPVVTDGDRTLAESALIIEYLARCHGDADWTRSPGDADYWDFGFWMHYAEGSLMPPLLIKLIFSKLREAPVPWLVRPISSRIADRVEGGFTNPQIETHFRFVDDQLAGRDWLLGNKPSAADIMLSFPLEAALARGTIDREEVPAIAEYVERFQSRPAYRRALEAGGDYDYGPADH